MAIRSGRVGAFSNKEIEKIVLDNYENVKKKAWYLYRQYKPVSLSFEDCLHYGIVGLIKSLKHGDIASHDGFSLAYANRWVELSIRDAITRKDKVVKCCSNDNQVRNSITIESDEFEHEGELFEKTDNISLRGNIDNIIDSPHDNIVNVDMYNKIIDVLDSLSVGRNGKRNVDIFKLVVMDGVNAVECGKLYHMSKYTIRKIVRKIKKIVRQKIGNV